VPPPILYLLPFALCVLRSLLASLPPCNLPCRSRVSMLRLRTMRVRVPFREPVTVALDTLRAHKLRSFLMLLGIILSVSTLIVVVGLIEGTNRYRQPGGQPGSQRFSR